MSEIPPTAPIFDTVKIPMCLLWADSWVVTLVEKFVYISSRNTSPITRVTFSRNTLRSDDSGETTTARFDLGKHMFIDKPPVDPSPAQKDELFQEIINAR